MTDKKITPTPESVYYAHVAASMGRWTNEPWEIGDKDDSIVRKSDGLEFTFEYVPNGDFYWITTPGFPPFHAEGTHGMMLVVQYVTTLYPYQQDPAWRYPVLSDEFVEEVAS